MRSTLMLVVGCFLLVVCSGCHYTDIVVRSVLYMLSTNEQSRSSHVTYNEPIRIYYH